jgi:hypothetical protein
MPLLVRKLIGDDVNPVDFRRFGEESPVLAFSIKAAATLPFRCALRPASSSNVSKIADRQ